MQVPWSPSAGRFGSSRYRCQCRVYQGLGFLELKLAALEVGLLSPELRLKHRTFWPSWRSESPTQPETVEVANLWCELGGFEANPPQQPGSFPKERVPYFWVLIIRIPLNGVLYSGPHFRKLPPPKSLVNERRSWHAVMPSPSSLFPTLGSASRQGPKNRGPECWIRGLGIELRVESPSS